MAGGDIDDGRNCDTPGRSRGSGRSRPPGAARQSLGPWHLASCRRSLASSAIRTAVWEQERIHLSEIPRIHSYFEDGGVRPPVVTPSAGRDDGHAREPAARLAGLTVPLVEPLWADALGRDEVAGLENGEPPELGIHRAALEPQKSRGPRRCSIVTPEATLSGSRVAAPRRSRCQPLPPGAQPARRPPRDGPAARASCSPRR